MSEIILKYGHCIIPKNTFLFRGHLSEKFEDVMFFATKIWMAKNVGKGIQVWKTKSDIEVGFFVNYLNPRSHAVSSIPKIYSTFFPEEKQFELSDLDIKLNPKRMVKLVSRLKSENILGWLTSYENREELEICFINKKKTESSLIFVESSNKNNALYFKDSLSKIKIFPANSFFEISKSKITEKSFNSEYSKNIYRKYKKSISTQIQEDVLNGDDKIKAIHFYYNLRQKLKI